MFLKGVHRGLASATAFLEKELTDFERYCRLASLTELIAGPRPGPVDRIQNRRGKKSTRSSVNYLRLSVRAVARAKLSVIKPGRNGKTSHRSDMGELDDMSRVTLDIDWRDEISGEMGDFTKQAETRKRGIGHRGQFAEGKKIKGPDDALGWRTRHWTSIALLFAVSQVNPPRLLFIERKTGGAHAHRTKA